MITSRINLTSLFLGILVLVAGCDSTGVITEPITPQSKETTAATQPSVIDGRIVFDDIDEFRIFMEAVIDKEDTYLDSVQAAIDFVSLRSDTERLAEELGKDIDELEVVEDPFFATVLNPDGEFQVGDVVYKITRNYVYQVSEENLDYLSPIFLRNPEHVVLTQKTVHDPVVETYEVERVNTELAKTSGRRDSCTSYFSDRRRIKGQAWLSNWGVYMSATTEIESQRKSWFRWWHNRIQSVSLDADYSVTESFRTAWGYEYSETLTDSYSHTKYNAAEIRKNLTWGVAAGGGVVRVTGWISSTYSGSRSDGLTGSCSTHASR